MSVPYVRGAGAVILVQVVRIAKNSSLEELIGCRANAGHSLQYQLQTDRSVLGSIARRNEPPANQSNAPAAALVFEAVELFERPAIPN